MTDNHSSLAVSHGFPSRSEPRAFLAALTLLSLALALSGCGSPPQVLEDEETFKAVDALWTAITAHRTDLLEQSAANLQRLRSEDRLSEPGLEALTAIIAQARDGDWTPAAKDLKAFIQGQRRHPQRS